MGKFPRRGQSTLAIAEICAQSVINKDIYHTRLKEKSDFSDSIKKAKEEYDEMLLAEAKNLLLKRSRDTMLR